MKTVLATRCAVLSLLSSVTLPGFSAAANTPSEPRPFTAADDVGLALFEYAGRGVPGGVIKYSPDGLYFAVLTERGRLDRNAPEDTIWVFRIEDVQRFVRHPDGAAAPAPVVLAQMAT